MIQPGAAILGVLGGGQLGQLFVQAASRLGYGVWVYDPDPDAPAAQVAARHFCQPFADQGALAAFCAGVAAVTVEREQVPLSTLTFCASRVRLRPGLEALRIAQDRRLEKQFFQRLGLPTVPFAIISEDGDRQSAARIPFPAILKSAQDGYDGKGQVSVPSATELPAAWDQLGKRPAVLESRIALQQEFSLILVRESGGMTVFYPLVENRHRQGILDYSIVPAHVPENIPAQAHAWALAIAEALDYVGVLAVEFFLDSEGRLLLNEMAPRPHNSGHFSIDACVHSQFDQQVRALVGLPLGETRLLSPVLMQNLLGDLWLDDKIDWEAWLRHPQVKVHLYGKKEARRGRKMGHLNILTESREAALRTAESLF